MSNIVISGVGGQGVILASDILSEVALKNGFDAKKAEVHGMAQRGGSVLSHVRFSDKVYSPLIQKGSADILMSFELLEALRYLDFLSPDGLVIVNEQKIFPPTITTGKAKYPDNILDILKQNSKKVIAIDAIQTALNLGNIKTVNVLLIGILSNFLSFTEQSWLDVILSYVPKKATDINKKAFWEGREKFQ